MNTRKHLNVVVEIPSIAEPIQKSPGFAKKDLATYKLDLMGLCGFSCRYCSSTAGNYLRINREKFADFTEAQIGERLYPATSPELAFTWPDVLDKLDRQLAKHDKTWGAGHTLVMSMLTDAFSGPPLHAGITRQALDMVLARTSFRVRILTKNSTVGNSKEWLDYFVEHRDRVVVGLSTGSLDDEWARSVEIGCPPPSARVRATRALQDAGIPTFGMLCPIFPDVLEGDGLERLVGTIRPDRCETVWAEPYNDRANWKSVRDGYQQGSPGWNRMTEIFERDGWSRYATDLYLRLREIAERDGWLNKLAFMLYEDGITDEHARQFPDLRGVLLQSPTDKQGRSKSPVFAGFQAGEEDEPFEPPPSIKRPPSAAPTTAPAIPAPPSASASLLDIAKQQRLAATAETLYLGDLVRVMGPGIEGDFLAWAYVVDVLRPVASRLATLAEEADLAGAKRLIYSTLTAAGIRLPDPDGGEEVGARPN